MATPAPDAPSSVESCSGAAVELLEPKLDEAEAVQPLPPALPPRPPPRPRQQANQQQLEQVEEAVSAAPEQPGAPRGKSTALRRSCWLRKYVFLCTACGGLAVLLGALFLTVYFMLRSYTSSLNYFETVPTYVPAAMLIVTGLIVMCLAGRRNRYGYLIKLCGGCCLACAVLCVVVTITTTVIHMNRLQTLRECVYTQKTQTCTCYSVIHEPTAVERGDEGVRYVFNSTPDCEVIHGALYSCLRAMFGLSVIGILICIFSCMLVYQLLSHEKKKMYWEQLEMRCRYLYRQQRNPHHCTCCDECRYPPPHELFPWEVMDDRYWTPGRVGNLYSPNPGEEGGPSTQRATSGWSWRRLPWARGTSSTAPAPSVPAIREQVSGSAGYRNATSSPDSQYGFSSRPTPIEVETHPAPFGRDSRPVGPTPQSGQQQQQRGSGPFMTDGSVSSIQIEGYGQRYYMWGPPPPYSNPHSTHNSPARREPILNMLSHHGTNTGNVPGNSGTTSPSSRFHYQHHHHLHHHHHHCQMNQQQQGTQAREGQGPPGDMIVPVPGGLVKHLQRHRVVGGMRRFQDQRRFDEFSSSSGDGVINMSDGDKSVIVENYMNTSEAEMATSGDATSENNTDSSTGGKERISNTLPARKTKKRIDISSVKSVANIPFSLDHQMNQKSSPSHFVGVNNQNSGSGFPRTNVQMLFGQQGCHEGKMTIEEVGETFQHSLSGGGTVVVTRSTKDGSSSPPVGNMSPRVRYMSHLQGVTNTAFQEQEGCSQGNKSEPTESEVYFADVSSCCNVSVRNDGQDSSLYDEALDPQKQRLMILTQREGPSAGGHLQRLPESFAMSEKNNHHHHRRLLQAEVMPGGNHHQFQRHPLPEMMSDKGHPHHHRLLSSEGGALTCIGPDEQELSSNCFSYQRQSSTRNRMPFPLPLHPNMVEQDSSAIEEDIDEGVCRQNIVSCGRDFLESEMLRKSGNARSDMPKDPSQQSMSVSSNSTGTPLTENNESSFISPMSVSTSSPGSFPNEPVDNCGTYYRNENGSLTEIVTPSGSTSVICTAGNEVFENYPPPQKIPYDQSTIMQQSTRLHHLQQQQQQKQRNNNFHSQNHENQTEYMHSGDQHFLAPDAQYETIPQQAPQNTVQQSYQCHIHQKNFGQSREDFNGNTPPNSPGKNNLPTGRPNVMAGPPLNVSSPARRRLNLPLHVTTSGGNSANNANNNMIESLYHTATSTEEEESESHQQQSSSNCYSDATMDSGCHSGSEFASRRRGGSARASIRGTTGGGNTTKPMGMMTDEDGEGQGIPVSNMRSVNV